jgi:antitoxin (DNA-binding transcriptional repressor) of toxin-antitoxin stability system
MQEKRMKSDQVRTGWRDALEYVKQGGRIVIEHYQRPVAMLVPYEPQETPMPAQSDTPASRGEGK